MATKHNCCWSSNVTYTGLTKIHSDTQSGATARNTLANRRASCTLATESNLHQKELRALDLNKQALKSSMIAYTQKMQELTVEKSDQTYLRKFRARARTDFPRSFKPIRNDAFFREASLESVTNDKTHSKEREDSHDVLENPMRFKNDSYDGNSIRLSVDSGISVGSHEDDLGAISNIGNHWEDSKGTISNIDNHDCSDFYSSDSESMASSSHLSTKSENVVQVRKAVQYEGGAVSDTDITSQDDAPRRMKRYRKKWRIGKENPLLPTVQDNERVDDACLSRTADGDDFKSCFSIQPFPVENLSTVNVSQALASSNVYGPILSSRYRSCNGTDTVAEERKVTFKPKPTQSPSVTRIRLRHPKKKSKQDTKQFQHCFRYSELFEETPESTNFCNGQRFPSLTHPENTEQPELSMGTIKEMSPELETEDSASVSLFAEIDDFGRVEVVSKRSEKVLKSALRSPNISESHKIKHVHFFLPDILKR
ncbi:hypothetical protein ElyMa_002263600 [Elysia marginata]|uniref:Shugoshin C-terminal domain-containing protein n=1 Tax=Elysia marginata TaxID=1093978 RepID=A0AAV4G065_9GAST|nr:hypothetical protein ElyMa_002263600 [Elysia marginata]